MEGGESSMASKDRRLQEVLWVVLGKASMIASDESKLKLAKELLSLVVMLDEVEEVFGGNWSKEAKLGVEKEPLLLLLLLLLLLPFQSQDLEVATGRGIGMVGNFLGRPGEEEVSATTSLDVVE